MTTRVEMLKGFPRGMTVCEAGTRTCDYTKYMAGKWLDAKKVWMIDYQDEKVNQNFAKVHEKCQFIQGRFDEVIPQIGEIDMVYIDGWHSYEDVSRDLRDFDPITKRYFAGHDWIPEDAPMDFHNPKKHKFEVRQAVTDWLEETGYYLTFVTDDLSNRQHDPDAKGGQKPLYSWVVSKTEEDRDLFLENLNAT